MDHGAALDGLSIDILAIIGATLLVAFVVGRLAHRTGIPQVVGFIVAGVILGSSFLHVIPMSLVENLDFVSELALGLIGFEMGLHLRLNVLRRLGRSIIAIVLLQALGPFLLVTVGVTLLTGDFLLAVLLGVLATATAPAATVDVLEEYKADGPLTTSIVAVVGIDDALALLLYSIVVPLVESTFGQVAAPSLLTLLELPFIEIGGSILVGILLGLPLSWYVDRHCDDSAAQIAVIVGVVFLSTGLSRTLSLSLILTTMTLGTVVVNLAARGTACVRDTIEQASPVLYMLFFALVGARFRVQETFADGLLLALGAVQIMLRAVGKYGGAWLGALISGAERAVRDNIGMALLSQAGVAVGLALSINQRFSAYGGAAAALGAKVLTVITATTFVVQLVGPVLVKLAISRAGEIGQEEGAATLEKVAPAD